MQLLIDLTMRQIAWFSSGQLIKSYPIAVGKPTTPTPLGNYQIINKIMYPGGGLGSRWMELNIPTDGGPYGIHGTNNPSSIGQAVSNGCIRMFNQDIEAIFPNVSIGTPVQIVTFQQWQNSPVQPGYTGIVHYVQQGDTFWQIAQAYGVSPNTLILVNPDVNPNVLYPGQKLIIPI